MLKCATSGTKSQQHLQQTPPWTPSPFAAAAGHLPSTMMRDGREGGAPCIVGHPTTASTCNHLACVCHATRLTFYRSSFHVADVEMAQDEVSAINSTNLYEQLLIPARRIGLLRSNERECSKRQQCLVHISPAWVSLICAVGITSRTGSPT